MTNTMLNKARQIITDVQAEGSFSIEKAKKAILKEFADISDYSAERIARTETIWGYEEANYQAYTATNGAVDNVSWLVFQPCDICEQNANEIVKLGGTFPSGHLHPPAHPNCKCSVAPYYGI